MIFGGNAFLPVIPELRDWIPVYVERANLLDLGFFGIYRVHRPMEEIRGFH